MNEQLASADDDGGSSGDGSATRGPKPEAGAPPAQSSTWQGLSPGFVREAAADRLKALAHPDRLRIIEALAAGPKTVSEIGAIVGRSMNAVSRNLRVLRDARVVHCSKRGNSVLYVLADRDVARLAAVAYRGAGGQVRRVVSLVPTVEPGGAATEGELMVGEAETEDGG